MPFDQQGLIVKEELQATPSDPVPAEWPFYLIAGLIVAGWVGSVAIWGLPGLFIPAVLAVPAVFVMLVRLTLG